VAAQIEVCNRAVIKLGGSTLLTSLSDNSKLARTFAALWDTCRKAELRKRNWNFALARDELAKLSAAPPWGFGNQFQLPTDFLRLVQVSDVYVAPGLVDYRNSDDSPYAIEGQHLLTDFGDPLKIRYVRDVTDPGFFDALFVECLACKLAFEACYAVTQSREGQRVAMDDYKLAVKDAAAANAIERPPQGLPDDSWVLGRL
jgi:hypothetical protein